MSQDLDCLYELSSNCHENAISKRGFHETPFDILGVVQLLILEPRVRKRWYSTSGTNNPPVVQMMCVAFTMCCCRSWRLR